MTTVPPFASPPPPLPGAVYLAPRGFEAELEEELRRKGLCLLFRRDRLVGTEQAPVAVAWAENTWLAPQWLPCLSIADGARRLKALQRNWVLYPTAEYRRAALVREALPGVSARPLVFGSAAPAAPLGAWTLWDKGLILASPRCLSPFPNGEARFAEDKTAPPNRAYLKLWECFTRIGARPGPGDVCLDLGSAPGGWTWVLSSLGARVFSVDKASLAPRLEAHPLVEHCRGSAFAFDPSLAGDISWMFCDVACYPERLYAMVRRWLDAGVRTNIVCTIKFAGRTNFDAIDNFSQISGSHIFHLYANKHELTWIRLVKPQKLL